MTTVELTEEEFAEEALRSESEVTFSWVVSSRAEVLTGEEGSGIKEKKTI